MKYTITDRKGYNFDGLYENGNGNLSDIISFSKKEYWIFKSIGEAESYIARMFEIAKTNTNWNNDLQNKLISKIKTLDIKKEY
jgi:hypothetical protein